MTTICHPRLHDGPIHRRPAGPEQATPDRFDRGDSHPTAGAPPAEIVSHLVQVHHRSLRDGLLWVESLIDKAGEEHPASREWSAIFRKFAELHDELACCLLHERSAVLPAFASGVCDDWPGLRDAVRAIGKTHARLLQRFWTLTAQVAAAGRAAPAGEESEALAAELSDLVDDYYQHLFEEECLLFPQLAAVKANGAGTFE